MCNVCKAVIQYCNSMCFGSCPCEPCDCAENGEE